MRKHIPDGITYSGEGKYKCKNCGERYASADKDEELCQNE